MIYLDNAATTAMSPLCLDIFRKYGVECFYNPSALYSKALETSLAVKKAREYIAKSLGANSSEILFTASGSEADNIAMFCANKFKKGKIIIGSVEHSAIFNCAKELGLRGFDVLLAPCDKFGKTDLSALEKMLDDDVVLVSIMHVCNETGAINDISKISALIKKHSPNAILHSDGVQAFGKIPVNVVSLGVDLYSISAHKIHAPKGVGALYVSKKINLKTFIFGGGQENNIRSATENVAGIVSFGEIAAQMQNNLMSNYKHMKNLQTTLINKLQLMDNLTINTNIDQSAPHIVSFCLDNARGETVVHCMEDRGIIIGTGSACSAKKSTLRIPKALGLNEKFASGMLRVSFCNENTLQEIDILIENLKEVIGQLSNYQRN